MIYDFVVVIHDWAPSNSYFIAFSTGDVSHVCPLRRFEIKHVPTVCPWRNFVNHLFKSLLFKNESYRFDIKYVPTVL